MNSLNPIQNATHYHPQYRSDIDGLRAIAVLSVIVYHAFPKALKGGFIGVDIFFVISGFLISSILFKANENNAFSFLEFYQRRAKRIFPALLLVLVACFVYSWFNLIPPEFKQLGKHISAGALFMANFALWSEVSYFDASAESKPLLHLWSLAIEEQFYIIFPLLIWILYKFSFTKNKKRFFILIFSLLCLSFFINVAMVKKHATATFYLPSSRFWELLVGSVLAYLSVYKTTGLALLKSREAQATPNSPSPTTTWSHWQSVLGLLLIVCGLLFLSKNRTFPGFWALLPTIGAYLLIAAGSHAWVNRYLLSHPIMVWFGLISYPLYVWHWPLLAFSFTHYHGTTPASVRSLLMLGAIVLAWLTYRFVERPIRFATQTPKRHTVTVWALWLSMALMAFIGYNAYQREGYPFRFPKFISELTQKAGNVQEGWRVHTCMLEYNEPASQFAADCVDNRRPLVFLWGDSHAGSLYPGFKAVQAQGKYKFGIAQRTAAVCPPILGVEPRPLCQSLNDANFALLKQLKPEIVVMYAFWHHHLYDLNKLDATIAQVKQAGVGRIIILGPSPYWQGNLPNLIVEQWKKGPPMRKPPLYMKEGLAPEIIGVTARMREIAQRNNVEFISNYEHLCNENGCLTRDSENSTTAASFDYGHLSVPSATLLIERIAPLIFK